MKVSGRIGPAMCEAGQQRLVPCNLGQLSLEDTETPAHRESRGRAGVAKTRQPLTWACTNVAPGTVPVFRSAKSRCKQYLSLQHPDERGTSCARCPEKS